MRKTQCECTEPGWCQRHQCFKTRLMWQVCRRNPAIYKLWEEGRGPGQPTAGKWRTVVEAKCSHRGDIVRTQECPTCAGRVQLKVFSCELHTECTLVKVIDGMACCAMCDDYTPTRAPETGAPVTTPETGEPAALAPGYRV